MAIALKAPKKIRLCAQVTWLTAISLSQVSALNIELDYGFDIATDNFFASNAAATAALEQAAADIGALITTPLGAVEESYLGINGAAYNRFNWDYVFKNPSLNGVTETITAPSLAANTVKIYVGMRELDEFTLGAGNPSAGSITIQRNNGPDLQGALDIATAKSNLGIGRGGGPVIANISGSVSSGETYDLNIGTGIGSVWFDIDTNNDTVTDNAATLESNWHFDHTTALDANKYDFYTVAVHEILHALGVGQSQSWDDHVSGANWTGSEAIGINGTGIGLLEFGSGHIDYDITSARISDGQLQRTVMASSIARGERRLITELDVALLTDIGYAAVVPEPSSVFLLGITFPLLLFRRKK